MSNLSGAVFSDCGAYRYLLWRRWADLTCTRPPMGFIMLNPSTADALIDDPTIRRCVGFAKREGCSGITVANLYGYRATDPAELADAADPVGPENDQQIADMMLDARHSGAPIVVAWGTKGSHRRAQYVKRVAEVAGVTLYCLGVTKDGHPRHPLYVRGDQPLVVLA